MKRKQIQHSFTGAQTHSAKLPRSAARRFIELFLKGRNQQEDPCRNRLLLEPLESRQLMAGDVDWASTNTVDSTAYSSEIAGLFDSSGLVAEGEATNDLVAFAKALDQAGVTFYGAAWCPFCNQQKTLFGDGKEELPFVEVTNPDRTINAVGQANNITTFPTWEFPDGTRATGVLTLQELSTRSGVAIPQSENPIFAPIGNKTVEIGSPLMLAVDGYDPDGQPLTVTVSVANTSLLQATVQNNNRSARIKVENWGEMVFELFEDKAPRATARFIELAQAGFYNASDTSEIIFHRVIDDFVLQAGDPTGTGSGGSTLGDFDDSFSPDLQHNQTGLLSYAKSLDDTNDSQFFITEGAQRHLDYNHSIFGKLVEGDSVREAISETKLTNSRPDIPVVIESVEIFQDTENSIIMLKALGATGTTDVTITITDASGRTFTEVITVTITADTVNAQPYLADIPAVNASAGAPAEFTITGIDVENDPIVYEARVVDNSGATATVNQTTRKVTVTPAANFSGQVVVEVAARSASTATSTNASTRSSTMDLQQVAVNFGPQAPTAITLNTASDSGVSNSDRITNQSPISFTVTGVTPGAVVEVLSGDTQIGVATATSTTVTVTTNNFAALGNMSHVVTARQTVNGQASGKTASINVTYDSVVPPNSSALPTQASVATVYQGNLQNTEEGAGLRYAILSGPAGATVDAVTGQITWTPTTAQIGNQTLSVRMTDIAGNTRDQSFTINVGSEALASIRLEFTDLNNNVITQIAPGQEFKVRVFGDDERVFTPQGVYALYTDLLFDPALAEVVTTNTFEYGASYQSGKSGTIGSGIIDQAGAFSSQTSFLGPGEQFIFSVRMKALVAGTLTVASDPAELVNPDNSATGHEIALFDRDDAVPISQVQYGAASLVINAAFTAVADTVTVAEDSSANVVNVLANDTIVTTGTVLTVSAVSAASSQGGSVSLTSNQVRYTPKANFFGTDTFTYTARDQNGATQTATVTVTVTNVNDAPDAVNDAVTIGGNTTNNSLNVLANDTQLPDTGETLRVTAIGSTSAGGTVSLATGGTAIIYTPKSGYTGTETFTYTLSDGTLTDTATVTVTVTTPNPPPTAVNDSFTVVEDAAAADFNVILNDSNTDTTETFALSAVGTAANGTAALSADGTRLRYQPRANFNGTDTVTYTIRDSNGATATATVTFTVTAVNDAPPAPNTTFSVVKGLTTSEVLNTSTLIAQNVDSGETLTITAVGTATAGGTVTIASNGQSVSYRPATATFTGNDTFTYTVRDAAGLTTTGTMTISVLDYVPRDFSIGLSLNSNSTWEYQSLSNVYAASLTGTDFQGQAINSTAAYNPTTGKFEFSDRAPGTYQISFPSIPFLRNSTTPIVQSITSETSSTADVAMDVELGELQSQYLSIRDFLSTAPTSAVFAIVEKGKAHTWMIATENANTPSNITVRLSADAQQVTIEADAATGTTGRRSVTLPITSTNVDVRATSGDYYLLKLNVHTTQLTYTAVTGSQTAASGEASTAANSLSSQSSVGGIAASGSQGASNGSASNVIRANDTAASNALNVVNYALGTNSAFQPGTSTTNASLNSNPFSAAGLVAEGEASADFSTPEEDDLNFNMVSTPNIEEFDTEDATSVSVDSAMLDLLPQLELRSSTGDLLASADDEGNVAAIDATFQWLGSNDA